MAAAEWSVPDASEGMNTGTHCNAAWGQCPAGIAWLGLGHFPDQGAGAAQPGPGIGAHGQNQDLWQELHSWGQRLESKASAHCDAARAQSWVLELGATWPELGFSARHHYAETSTRCHATEAGDRCLGPASAGAQGQCLLTQSRGQGSVPGVSGQGWGLECASRDWCPGQQPPPRFGVGTQGWSWCQRPEPRDGNRSWELAPEASWLEPRFAQPGSPSPAAGAHLPTTAG